MKWTTIAKAAIVYAGVGIFHFIFREKFLLISNNPEQAYAQGINVRFWDFLFYVSFGIVITHSVGTAGVLLVFVFLVVPAIASILITDILWKQLVIGWGMGLLVSVAGLYISYIADLPSGPTVVASYGLTLLILVLVLYMLRAQNWKKAFSKIFLGIAVAIIITLVFRIMGHSFSGHSHHEEDTNLVLTSPLTDKAEAKPVQLSGLQKAYQMSDDVMDKLDLAKKIAALNPKMGIGQMIDLLESSEFPFIREEILKALKPFMHNQFGFEADGKKDTNIKALQAMREWLSHKYKK